jgi:hypothetical protein
VLAGRRGRGEAVTFWGLWAAVYAGATDDGEGHSDNRSFVARLFYKLTSLEIVSGPNGTVALVA